MSPASLFLLGWSGFNALVKRPFKARRAVERVLRRFAAERIVSLDAADRDASRGASGCLACGRCDEVPGPRGSPADWVLGGRALQDVWILPGIFHGTTLRIPDAAREAWHVIWSDPLHHYYGRQLGRAVGADIVQLGRDDTGQATRWSFSERTPDGFTWRGETADDAAGPWTLVAEFHCRRVPA